MERGVVRFSLSVAQQFSRILDTCHASSLRFSDSQYPRRRRISNLSPFHSASGYQDYRIRRETEEFRCNPPTETSGVRAPGTFLGDASSIFENQEKTLKKCKLKMKSYCWRRLVFEPLILINLHFLPLSYISAQNVHHPSRRITVR